MRCFEAIELGQRHLVVPLGKPVHRMRGDGDTTLRVHIGDRAACRLIPIDGMLDTDGNQMEVAAGDFLADQHQRTAHRCARATDGRPASGCDW